jgi:hypothetical protein
VQCPLPDHAPATEPQGNVPNPGFRTRQACDQANQDGITSVNVVAAAGLPATAERTGTAMHRAPYSLTSLG